MLNCQLDIIIVCLGEPVPIQNQKEEFLLACKVYFPFHLINI